MNIEEKVKNILSELSGEEVVVNEATLQGKLALDSLSMVTLLIQIEEEFGIELEESDMNPFELTNVQSVIDMVKKYCGGEENEKE
ncbi:MAG: acyl carrier protein [Ruminococcaceae bacterium]|nr:acyl carrier protein [Oscillospiraceae bacterium]